MNRGWSPILPSAAGLWGVAPANQRSAVALGFTHRAGRCCRLSSPGCRRSRYIEECLDRGWGPILPECDETGRGATPAARASSHDGRGRAGREPSDNGTGAQKRGNESNMPIVLHAKKSARFVCLSFILGCAKRRSQMVYAGTIAYRHGIVSGGRRLRPRLVGAVDEV